VTRDSVIDLDLNIRINYVRLLFGLFQYSSTENVIYVTRNEIIKKFLRHRSVIKLLKEFIPL